MATPYGTKTGYPASNPDPYDEAPRRAHRKLHCLDFILRVLTAMATAAAIVTLLFSFQTIRGVRVRWIDFGAFKYLLVANAVVCAYTILAALASLIGVCTRRGPLSSTPIAWLTFLVDLLLANALMAAAAASTTLAWIGNRGESAARWAPNCGAFHRFCTRIGGSLITTYIAWIFLILSTILAAIALHKLRRRVAY